MCNAAAVEVGLGVRHERSTTLVTRSASRSWLWDPTVLLVAACPVLESGWPSMMRSKGRPDMDHP